MSKILNRNVFYYPNIIFENTTLIGIKSTEAKNLFAYIYNLADDDGVAVFSYAKDMRFAFPERRTFNNNFAILVDNNIIEDRRSPTDHYEDITVYIKEVDRWGKKVIEETLKDSENKTREVLEVHFDPTARENQRVADAVAIYNKHHKQYDLTLGSEEAIFQDNIKIIEEMYNWGVFDSEYLADATLIAEKVVNGIWTFDGKRKITDTDLSGAIRVAMTFKNVVSKEAYKVNLLRRIKLSAPHLTDDEVLNLANVSIKNKQTSFKFEMPKDKIKSEARKSVAKVKKAKAGEEVPAVKPIKSNKPKKSTANDYWKNTESICSVLPDRDKEAQAPVESYIKDLNPPAPKEELKSLNEELSTGVTPIKKAYKFNPNDYKNSKGEFVILKYPWYMYHKTSTKEEFLEIVSWIPTKADLNTVQKQLFANAKTARSALLDRGKTNLFRKYCVKMHELAKLYDIINFFDRSETEVTDEDIEFYLENHDLFDWWSLEILRMPEYKYDPYTDPEFNEGEE